MKDFLNEKPVEKGKIFDIYLAATAYVGERAYRLRRRQAKMARTDYDWFVDTELTEYRGEYVIILDEEVVFHGKNLTEILKKFRKHYPNQVPKIAKIPEEETLILGC